MRLPFYTIAPDSYLFASKLTAQGELNLKEEPVRQWCAFELIRAYGIKVSDISFEEEVRVGSKIYRIDILVRRNGLPWLVVECKAPEHSKPEAGLEQAISYASSTRIMAEYAVYTNGTVWQAKRRLESDWHTVSDLPVTKSTRDQGSIDELLITMERVSPLLHKLDKPLSGRDARLYLDALQRFFHGANLITAEVDHDLRMATDNLLRVLWSGSLNEPYSREKLSAASKFAERFRQKTGIGDPLFCIQKDEHIHSFMKATSGCLHEWVTAGRGMEGAEPSLARLFLSLLNYGARQAQSPGSYPLFPAHLHTSLREFLTKAMALSMNVRVPEALDEEFTSDMGNFTRSAWDQIVRDDSQEQHEAQRDFLASLFGALRFWRPSARRRESAANTE